MRWLLLFLAACGDPRGTEAPPPDVAASADSPVDAEPDPMVCTAASPLAPGIDVATTDPTPLTLDGIGTRCDQLTRAILDPAQRPPSIASLDAQSGVGPPLCTEFPDREAVRIDINNVLGRRLLSGGQWLLAWVRKTDNTVIELTGWYVEPPVETPTACASDQLLRDAVIGHEQPYTTFQLCAATGGGKWAITEHDVRVLGDAGWYHDGTRLHAAREISVGVAADAVTPELAASDLNCCAVIDDQDGCIGLVLVIDAESGKVLGSRRRCDVC